MLLPSLEDCCSSLALLEDCSLLPPLEDCSLLPSLEDCWSSLASVDGGVSKVPAVLGDEVSAEGGGEDLSEVPPPDPAGGEELPELGSAFSSTTRDFSSTLERISALPGGDEEEDSGHFSSTGASSSEVSPVPADAGVPLAPSEDCASTIAPSAHILRKLTKPRTSNICEILLLSRCRIFLLHPGS